MHPDKLRQLASQVLTIEAQAVEQLKSRIDGNFVGACDLMLHCQGRIVVLGIGKSGHIGGKIAATLASTGSPAFFVHPAEASHGDMGMITARDVVLALSNSGETDEILTLLPLLKRLGVPLIALTGNPASTLANNADVHIDVSVSQEALSARAGADFQHHRHAGHGRRPGGRAAGSARLHRRGFRPFPPRWPIGPPPAAAHRRRDAHRRANTAQRARRSAKRCLAGNEPKGLGTTVVVDGEERVLGVFTDGDLRRALDRQVDVHAARVAEVMIRDCKTIASGTLPPRRCG